MLIEPQISDGAKALGLSVVRQHPENVDGYFKLESLFTTYNGSWEPSNHIYSIPLWAREMYLRPFGASDYFDDAGADHHIFAGAFKVNEVGYYRRTGIDQYTALYSSDKWREDTIVRKQTKKHGWANIVMFASSSFSPERGETGPWQWTIENSDSVIVGGGMPNKHHVSIFAAWTFTTESQGPIEPPPVEPSDCEDLKESYINLLEDHKYNLNILLRTKEELEQIISGLSRF
jgi:hypothetical protein